MRFEPFLQLPTVLQHIVWSFAPRRSVLKYNALCREIRANTASIVAHTVARSPSITQKSMGDWIARLESLCEAMRLRVLADPALQPTEFALLFVSRVPPKTAVDPMAIIPGRRAYTGDDQAPQERALRELRRLSLHAPAATAATAASSSYCPPLPSIPILRSYNVQDSLQSTALRDLPDAAVSKILTKVRWVLSSWRALWAASLQELQRQEMDRREAAHEEKLNAGLESDHDYCEMQDQFARDTVAKEQEWEEECADLLFELRYVLMALLSYSAAAQAASSSTTGAVAASSSSSAASALVYTRELVNINDPDQTGQDTEEGVAGGRYTTLLWVLPQVKSRAQEEAEAEVAAAIERQRIKELEQAEEAERVRAMLERQEARHKHGPSSKTVAATPAVLSPEEALERAVAERDALRAFAAFKGEPEPTELREKLEQNIREATVAKHQADKIKAAAAQAAATAAQDTESSQSPPTSDAALLNSASSATAPATARVCAREGFDLPFFMIATTQFRDEKRANNSRRAMQLR